MKKSNIALSIFLTLSLQPVLANSNFVEVTLEKAGIKNKIIKIEPAEFSGWQQALLKGGHVLYVSDNGEYILEGSLIKNTKQGLINLTVAKENTIRAHELEQLPSNTFLTYNSSPLKSYITVFTDVGCPFCQKFHDEIKPLTDNGIGVRYLPFPRGGEKSNDFKVLTSVWCSNSIKSTFENAIRNKKIKTIECDTNSIKSSYDLGKSISIEGTPTIIFQDGSKHTGYMSATEIIKKLDLK